MSEYEGAGRNGARSDGRGGVSDGGGSKTGAGSGGQSGGSGGGGTAKAGGGSSSGRDKAREGKTAGGGGGGTTEAGGPERSGDAGHSGNDSSQSEADQQSTTETDVDIADWANQTQQHVLAQMARQGLVVGTDDQGNITSAEPERAASFNLLGANDMGTGTLRARTANEIAGYGIDLGNIAPQDRIRTIDPGASIASDVQSGLTAGGSVVAGPAGSMAGMIAGQAIDSSITASRLRGLGFNDVQADAIAKSATADRTTSRVTGLLGGLALGTLSGAVASSISDPVTQSLVGGGVSMAANKGLQLASQGIGTSIGQQVYHDTMNGTPSRQPSRLGAESDKAGQVLTANAGQARQPAATVTASVAPADSMGQGFYDFVSKWKGGAYV